MIMKTIKVSEKGQIAIPQSIREQVGIEKGDEIIIFQVNGKLLIEKTQEIETKLEDDFKDIVKISEQSLKEVWDNKKDDIWGEYLKK